MTLSQIKKKGKEKLAAINELNSIIRNSEFPEIPDSEWKQLTLGIADCYFKELESHAEKLIEGNKSSATLITCFSHCLKDLLQLACNRHVYLPNQLFEILMACLEIDCFKVASKAVAKSLSILFLHRSFREHISPSQFQDFTDFSFNFFLPDKEGKENTQSADRRPENLDLAIAFVILMTSGENSAQFQRDYKLARKYLRFIGRYLCMYTVEGPAFELFLSSAIWLLLLIDVNDLEFSYNFLKVSLWRILDLIRSKVPKTQILAINLLRMYVYIGAHREEDDDIQGFMYTVRRIQKEAFRLIESIPSCNIAIENISLLWELEKFDERLPSSLCTNLALLYLIADLFWLTIQTPDNQIDPKDEIELNQGEKENYPRKKVKLAPNVPTLSDMMKNSKSMIKGIQIFLIMIKRHPTLVPNCSIEFGPLLLSFASFTEPIVISSVCLALSQMVLNGYDTELDRLWDFGVSVFANFDKLGAKADMLAPAFLLNSLILKSRVKTENLIIVINAILNLNSESLNMGVLMLINNLFGFGNIWNLEMIERMCSVILEGLLHFAETKNSKMCVFLTDMVLRMLEVLDDLQKAYDASPNWHIPCSMQYLNLSSCRIFDFMFSAAEKRITMASGFYGSVLASNLVTKNSSEKCGPTNEKRLAIFVKIFGDFAENLEKSPWVAADWKPILFSLFICRLSNSIPKETTLSNLARKFHDIALKSLEKSDQGLEIIALLEPFCTRGIELPEILASALFKTKRNDPHTKKESQLDAEAAGRTIDVLSLALYHELIPAGFIKELFDEMIVYFTVAKSASNEIKDSVLQHTFSIIDNLSSFESLLVLSESWKYVSPLMTSDICLKLIMALKRGLQNPAFEYSQLLLSCGVRFIRISYLHLDTHSQEMKQAVRELTLFYFNQSKRESISFVADFALLAADTFEFGKGDEISISNDEIQLAWHLSKIDNFQIRCFFAFEIFNRNLNIVSFFNTFYSNLDDSKQELSDVQCLGSAMIAAAVLLQYPTLRELAFSALCAIAFQQPSLDIVDCVFEKTCKTIGFKSSFDMCEYFVGFAIHQWSDLSLECFPHFLFGGMSSEDFFERYHAEIVLNHYTKTEEVERLEVNWKTDFCTLFVRELLLAKDDQCKIKIESFFLTKFTHEELNAAISRCITKASVMILTMMNGLEAVDFVSNQSLKELFFGLDVFENRDEGYKVFPDIAATRCLAALQTLLQFPLIEVSKNMHPYQILMIFDKIHMKIFRISSPSVLNRILNNGYRTLLAISGEQILAPAIFQIVIGQLCIFLEDGKLSMIAAELIRYCIQRCVNAGGFELINTHFMHLLKSLDVAIASALWEKRQLLVQSLLGIINLVLDCLETYSRGGENLQSISIALVNLDHTISEYQPIFDRFNFDFNDPRNAFYWLQHYDAQMGHSRKPFVRLSDHLDHSEFLKENISTIKKIMARVIIQSLNVVDEQNMDIISFYGKIQYLTSKQLLTLEAEEKDEIKSVGSSNIDYYTSPIIYLLPYLADRDTDIVSNCFKVLKNLMALPEGIDAFKRLTIAHQNLLSIFLERRCSNYESSISKEGLVFFSLGKTEQEWICSFSAQLICEFKYPKYFMYLECILLCSPDYATKMLPLLFHFILFDDLQKACPSLLSSRLVSFFQELDLPGNAIAVKHFLNVIKFLLHNDEFYILFDKWTAFDFNTLAKAALSIHDGEFAVYLLEFSFVWHPQRIGDFKWQTLLQAYRELENSEGFQGVIASCNTKEIQFFDVLEEKNWYERNWLSRWSMEDSILQVKKDCSTSAIVAQSLLNSGHYHTVMAMLDGSVDSTLPERFESLWRLGKWSFQEAYDDFAPDQLNRSLYNCLEHFQNSTSISHLQKSVDAHVLHFIKAKEGLIPLAFLEIREAISFRKCNIIFMQEVFKNWSIRLDEMQKIQTFSDIEKILAVRTRLLISALENNGSDQYLKAFLSEHLQKIVDLALSEKNAMLARTSALQLKNLFPPETEMDHIRIALLLHKIEWDHGEETIAMKFFKYNLDGLPGECPNSLRAEMLHTYGTWLMASKKAIPKHIIEEYLIPSTEYEKNCGKYHFQLAHYADSVLTKMLNDDILKRSERLLSQRLESYEALKVVQAPSKSRDYFLKKTKRQIDLERVSIKTAKNEMAYYLLISVENYLKALTFSNSRHEDAISRLLSLWFSNYLNTELNTIISEHMDKIPTSTFLVLMYQMAARLSAQEPDRSSIFFTTLSKLVSSIVSDYPYHSLGYFVALKNVSKGKNGTAGISNNSTAFLRSIMTRDTSLKKIVMGMDRLFTAYISAANQGIVKKGKNKYALEANSTILSFEETHQLPILTKEYLVLKPRDFSNIVYVSRFDRNFSVPGGINAPKVLKCLGSDGKVYKQLIKSKDDLRQDAVLSSVFEMVNKLLFRKPETRKMGLKIRTYKIVPLAPQAGVVQWVDGTLPLGDILNKAYNNTKCEWTTMKCREMMKVEQDNALSTQKSKLDLFALILTKLPTVFGSVFFQLYRDPKSWYHARTRYIKSVATSSMGGYMLGVGDRHAQNLLFDKSTGEIVHIDLGIAFDQGKLLSIPENVPFRLTRNMIEVMGSTAYEGEFKIGCQMTLSVLRKERDIIFTLLNVFRHDPLYSWSISPLRMLLTQQRESNTAPETEEQPIMQETNEGNSEADNALLGVDKKLSSSLSVECQIQELITLAVDPNNLCSIFHGWQAWI